MHYNATELDATDVVTEVLQLMLLCYFGWCRPRSFYLVPPNLLKSLRSFLQRPQLQVTLYDIPWEHLNWNQ